MSAAAIDGGRPRIANAPVPGPTPAALDRVGQPAAHPFAELLQQQTRATVVPAAPAAAAPAAPPASAPASHADNGVTEPTGVRGDAAQARARRAGATHDAAQPGTAKAKSTDDASARADAHDGAADDTSATATSAAVSPTAAAAAAAATATATDTSNAAVATTAQDPAQAIAAQALVAADTSHAQAQREEADAASAASGASTAGGTALRGGTPGAGGAAARADRTASAADPSATADDSDAAALATAPKASFEDTLADAKPLHAPTAGPDRPAPEAAALSAQQGAASLQASASSEASTASASVATPVDSPEFASAFGMQVGAMAKDGVQKAELHLNPAEMGPISIQITLDGKLAHVDFGADFAATRHAIEAGLPELASALRDAGFTLAGGGVSQHSASNGSGAGADDASSSRSAMASAGKSTIGAVDVAARRQSQRAAAGGVDVFA